MPEALTPDHIDRVEVRIDVDEREAARGSTRTLPGDAQVREGDRVVTADRQQPRQVRITQAGREILHQPDVVRA